MLTTMNVQVNHNEIGSHSGKTGYFVSFLKDVFFLLERITERQRDREVREIYSLGHPHMAGMARAGSVGS